MTTFTDEAKEVLEGTPCVQCDRSGAIQEDEDVWAPCQFCHQLRFPFIAEALTKLEALHRGEQRQLIEEFGHIIGHDEDLESAYDYDYRITQRTIKAHNKVIEARNSLREDMRDELAALRNPNNQEEE